MSEYEPTPEQVNNSFARKDLAVYELPSMPTYCGVPVNLLTHEETLKVLARFMKNAEQEQEIYRKSLRAFAK